MLIFDSWPAHKDLLVFTKKFKPSKTDEKFTVIGDELDEAKKRDTDGEHEENGPYFFYFIMFLLIARHLINHWMRITITSFVF